MTKFTERQIEIMEAATARIDKYGIQNLTIKTLAADINLSEPALYRHFESKNDILLGVLDYFISEMKNRIKHLPISPSETAGDELRMIFKSQLQTFSNKPAIVSVIFAESIFHYDEKLSYRVSEIMNLMHEFVKQNMEKGQKSGQYSELINASILTTILLGGIRMTVLKWKMSGHKSNLIENGNAIVESVLKMIEKNKPL